MTWERHQILEQSLQSLSRCNFPLDSHLVITDDKSEDPKVLESINSFKERVKDKVDVEIRVREKRMQSWVNNVDNMKYCLSKTKDDYVICLESDGIYNKDFLFKFLECKASIKETEVIGVLSLFHCDRFKEYAKGIYNQLMNKKEYAGAFCTMFHRSVIFGIAVKKGFDCLAIDFCIKHKLLVLCSNKSYAQHIGVGHQSMNTPASLNSTAKNFVGEG